MTHVTHHPLDPFTRGLPRGKPLTEDGKIRKQTQKWVAQTFYGTLLKQARESPFHSDTFEGGRGGQAFGALMDERLAEHMSRGVGNKLVDAIVKKIEAKNKAHPQAAPVRMPVNSTFNQPSLLRSVHAATDIRA